VPRLDAIGITVSDLPRAVSFNGNGVDLFAPLDEGPTG
jgi:hypothetical protein